MGVYQRPKSFRKRFEFVGDLFPALLDRRSQRAGSLSGGERQMVAMGRALMMEPSVLLLDEPSAGLSPVMQDEVFVQTRRINRAGVSVVMVEQNARRCLQICDRGYVLDQGRNAYTGTGEDLAKDPKVIELYLGTLAKALTAHARASAHVRHTRRARPDGRALLLSCDQSALGRRRRRSRPACTCCRRRTGRCRSCLGRGCRCRSCRIGPLAPVVVDVLAVLEQVRALLERRALGALAGDLDDLGADGLTGVVAGRDRGEGGHDRGVVGLGTVGEVLQLRVDPSAAAVERPGRARPTPGACP